MYQKIRKDIKRYLTSSSTIAVLDAIRVIAIARFLNPYYAGLCTTLLMIPQIAQYLNLGIIESLTILVPKNQGIGNKKYADTLKSTALYYTVLTSTLSFLGVLLYLLIFPPQGDQVGRSALCAGFLIILWEVRQFFTTNYAIENKILKLSWVEFSFTLIVTISQIVLVRYEGVPGFWLALIFANMMIIFYSGWDYFKNNKSAPPSIDFNVLKKIIPLGITMLITSVSYAPFVIISRIFLAGTVGVHEVGLFLLSIIVLSRIAIIPNAIAKVILLHMSSFQEEKLLLTESRDESSKDKASNNLSDTFSLFIRSQLYTFVLSILVIILGLILIVPLVSLILPEYILGVKAAKIMLITCIPYIMIDNANNVLLVLQHKRIFITNLIQALGLQIFIFTLLYVTKNVSANSISISLFFVFLYYAFQSNYKVFQLRRTTSSSR